VRFQTGLKLSEIEKSVILQTLRQQDYNRTKTAKALGIGIRTLQRKLKQYRETDVLENLGIESELFD
jgi:transcriptional regulator with PAS, ATPase and Fis domain